MCWLDVTNTTTDWPTANYNLINGSFHRFLCALVLQTWEMHVRNKISYGLPWVKSSWSLVVWFPNNFYSWPKTLLTGLGRVPDLRVRVLVICVSTSTSPSTWFLHEYKYEYEYCLMSTSTSMSTGLWSTFYIACIGGIFLSFGLWQESPQILTNLGQNSNCPLSIQSIFVNIYLFNYSM